MTPARDPGRAVFFDRDGVLNESDVRGGRPYAPRSRDAFRILPEAPQALRRVREAGFKIVVVTNQPDVGNGLVARAEVEAMHEMLRAALPVDDLRACFHRQNESCGCRKPRPGMLIDAAADLDLNLASCFMVGDRWSDVAAGKAAGCRTVFIDRGYSEPNDQTPEALVADVEEAATWIIANSHAGTASGRHGIE